MALMQQVSKKSNSIVIGDFPSLRRISFEFCRFHPNCLDLLRTFFQQTPSLESISFIKNFIASNNDISHVLSDAHNTELTLVLPGGKAALHHRHAIQQACQNRIEKLHLDFKGSGNVADELDEDMVACLPKMVKLKLLRLDGWTISDTNFAKLVKGIRGNLATALQSLHICRIRGLTCASLPEIAKLGVVEPCGIDDMVDDDDDRQEEKKEEYDRMENIQQQLLLQQKLRYGGGLEELHISMIPSLFVMKNDHSDDAQAAVANMESFFRNLSICQVTIQESRLDCSIVRAIFRGLAAQAPKRQSSAGISTFRLKAWSFSDDEF